jgi:hypothetical protein
MKILKYSDSSFIFTLQKLQIFTRGKYMRGKIKARQTTGMFRSPSTFAFPCEKSTGAGENSVESGVRQREENKLPFPHVNPFSL